MAEIWWDWLDRLTRRGSTGDREYIDKGNDRSSASLKLSSITYGRLLQGKRSVTANGLNKSSMMMWESIGSIG